MNTEIIEKLKADMASISEGNAVKEEIKAWVTRRNQNIRRDAKSNETKVIDDYNEYERMRQFCIDGTTELIRRFSREYISPAILTDREQLMTKFTETRRKLNKIIMFYTHVIRVAAREVALKIAQKLLPLLNDIRVAVEEIINSLEQLNNEHSLVEKTTAWESTIEGTRAGLIEINKSLLCSDIDQPLLDQLNILLNRIENLHSPPWYFQFWQAVGGNFTEQILRYKYQLIQYRTDIDGLIGSVEILLV